MLQASLRMTRVDPSQLQSFLSHCLERAVFARSAALAMGVDAECAYVGALLQDLLLPCLADSEYDVAGSRPEGGERIVDFERRVFGWDHAALAARVLKSWNIPDRVVCSVLLSHSSSEILSDPALRKSPLAAVAASALLPDDFRQEPQGVRQLMEWQQEMPELNYLQIAVDVDEELAPLESPKHERRPLCDRLAAISVQQIEEVRQEIVWTNERIGNYVLEREVGRGGMGLVYYARHATLHREAAIKLMKQRTLDHEELDRFEAEARLTSGLSSPHTVGIYDYGVTRQGVLYYVMEWLEGLSLAELVSDHGPQPSGRVVALLRQACESLAEAHQLGLIHRDIKPENIVLTAGDGVLDFVKVVDFGLAQSLQSSSGSDALSSTVCGTPLFLAPEAIMTPNEVDGRVDVYALGLVAYYLLSGRFAISGPDARRVMLAQLSAEPVPLADAAPGPIEPELEVLVMQCLRKRPSERPQGMLELSTRLSEVELQRTWTSEEATCWWNSFTRRNTPQSVPPQDEFGITRPFGVAERLSTHCPLGTV